MRHVDYSTSSLCLVRPTGTKAGNWRAPGEEDTSGFLQRCPLNHPCLQAHAHPRIKSVCLAQPNWVDQGIKTTTKACCPPLPMPRVSRDWDRQAYVMQEHQSEQSDTSCGSGLRSVLNIKGRKGSPHSVAWSFLFLLLVPNWFFIHGALLVYVQEPVGHCGCFLPKHSI